MNRAEAPFQRRHPLSTAVRPAGTFLGPEKQRAAGPKKKRHAGRIF